MPRELNSDSLKSNAALKAYFRFSSGALTTDSSGNSHTLTAIGTPAETTGVFAGGVSLDATAAYSATDGADFKPTTSFSIVAWVKRNTSSTTNYIFQSFAAASGNQAGFLLCTTATGLVRAISGKNGKTAGTDYLLITGTHEIDDNAWHLVVYTWDGTYLNLYVDDFDVESFSWANAPTWQTTSYVRVGCYCGTGSNSGFWTGSLDDVALFNGYALTAADVHRLYTNSLVYRAAGLKRGFVKTINGLAVDSAKTMEGLA